MNFSLSNKFVFTFEPRVQKDNIFDGKIDLKFLSSQISAINIPGISIGVATQTTPILQLPQIGSGSKQFNDLTMTFYIDEQWQTFKQIYEWFELVYNKEIIKKGIKEAEIVGNLMLTDNFMKPVLTIRFDNLFPFTYTDINLGTTVSEADVLSFDVTFKYDAYFLIT